MREGTEFVWTKFQDPSQPSQSEGVGQVLSFRCVSYKPRLVGLQRCTEENLPMEMFQQDRSRGGDLCHEADLCSMFHQKYWSFLTTQYPCGFHNTHINQDPNREKQAL